MNSLTRSLKNITLLQRISSKYPIDSFQKNDHKLKMKEISYFSTTTTTTTTWKPSNHSTSKANSLPSIVEHPDLYSFVLESTFIQNPPQLNKIYKEIEKHPAARMATAPDQTLFISTLVRIMNARYFLEVGYLLLFFLFYD